VELRFLWLINDYRENNGLGSLAPSDTFPVAAEHHSQDMTRYSFFAHNTVASSYYPAGSEPWDRMAAEGSDYNTYKGENIAVGYTTAKEAFEAWRNSPLHNRAMLDGRYHVIGIARTIDSGSVHGWYWTTDFDEVLDPSSHKSGENPQAQDAKIEPGPQPGHGREDRKEPVVDGPSVENGEIDGKAVWKQEATDGVVLILYGHARLGDYHSGRDNLRQKIRRGRAPRSPTGQDRDRRATAPVRPSAGAADQPEGRAARRPGEARIRGRGQVEARDGRPVAFAGRTVYLSFFVKTDPTLLTAFYLDRVTLQRGEHP